MAKSLQDCLKKAEGIISRDDKAAVLRMAETGTEIGATRALFKQLINEKQAILDEIERAGGNPEEWVERLEAEEVDFNPDLNEAGAAIEREFFDWLNARSWDEIRLMYASISKDAGFSENTHNGKTLNADAFRELFDRYRRNRLMADPAHEPSSSGIKKLLAKYIEDSQPGDLVFFTAGGPAAGKGQTQGLSAFFENADWVFDGTMSNFAKDDPRKIEKLVKKKVRVHISYSYMNPFTAFVGSLQRAMDMKKDGGSGRPVNKKVFIDGTVGANVTIRQMYEKYKDNPLVTFDFFMNERITDNEGNFVRVQPTEVTLDDIPQLSRADLEAEINEYVGELHATGAIDEEIFEHTINAPWRRKSGETAEGSAAKFERELQQTDAAYQEVPEPERGGEQGREAPRDTESRVAFSRAVSPEAQQNYARMRMALAVPIRQLAGTLNVSLLQTADEIPPDARPADDPDGNTVEGLWLRGTNEAFLVAENMDVQRAQQVLAHEAFGHAAMEQMPEFTKILDSIQNLKAVGNKTITTVAARVAASQPNLDSTTEAKEILATMAEMGVKSTTMDRAISAVRGALRRIFGVDLDFNEAEIRQLLVEGARGLQANARAKRAALAAKPLAQQILEDPGAVEAEIRNAIEEIYARSVMQDAIAGLHEELADIQDPGADPRAARIRAAIEQIENAPAVAPDVLYQTAYHGTGAPEFDRFDIKYIGQGEGAAAYGWGLYFSSKKAVADWYRRKLSRGYQYSYKGKTGLTEADVHAELTTDLFDAVRPMIPPDSQDNSPENQAVLRDVEHLMQDASNTATAVMSIFRRHRGNLADIKKEMTYQRDNFRKAYDNYQKMSDRDLHWGARGRERVIQEHLFTAEAYGHALDLVDQLAANKQSGTIFKVDVPGDDDILHWKKPISKHSQTVRDNLEKGFPELFKEQWMSGLGKPILDPGLVTQEMIDKLGKSELQRRGYFYGRPIDRMEGKDLYYWISEEMLNQDEDVLERLIPGFFKTPVWKGKEQLASMRLRELGIPGHSFIGWSSSETNYVIYDDSRVQILDAADDPQFLFSRAQPILKLDPTEMGGKPDPQVVAAGKLPPGESSRFYWQVAVGAQSKAVNYDRSSWERRYYDQLGELAARKAGEARRGGPEITEQMALFSRSETGTRKAKPGEPFTVYRFGSGADTLQNKNAGNAASVARRLAVFDDYEAPQSGNAEADVLSVWEITADEFTDYAAMNAGAGAGQGRGVGRQEMPASQRDPEYQEISYSFGTEGYTARKLRDVPLADVREMLRGQSGYTNFDDSGSIKGSQAVAMFSRAAPETPEFKRWFADSKIVNPDGSPRVVYHGTKAEDFTEFRARYDDNLLFFTTKPEFAEKWVKGVGGLREPPADAQPHIAAARMREREIGTEELDVVENYDFKKPEDLARYDADRKRIRDRMKAETGFESASLLQDTVGTRVMPVYLSIQKPFDARKDWKKIENYLLTSGRTGMDQLVKDGAHKTGNWIVYEERGVIAELKRMGYDGIWINENIGGEQDTIAAFSPEQVKSASGNRGTFDSSANISYSRGRVRGDDEIEAIRAHVLSPASEDITIKDRMRDVVNNLFGVDWLNVKQGMVDSAASVEALERGLNGGGLLDASHSAYKSVLATKNLGSVMAAVMHKGVPILREGVFQPRRGRQGLVEIFTPITQHADGNLLPLWELYAVARRAERLIGEKNPDGTSKEKRMTPEQIEKAKALGQQYPEFETAFLQWNKFNQQVLDLAVKTGVINQDERKVWAKNDYVPFYRAMEEIEGVEGEGPRPRGRGVEGVRSGIKRLSGSDAQIGHVFENMVMNTAYLVDASFRNDAMQRIVMMADGIAMEKIPMAWEAIKIRDGDMARALMKAGLLVVNGETVTDMFNDALMQVRAMTPEQKEHWSTVFRRVAPTGPDVVSVLMNGKPVYYRVDDPLLLRTIQGMGAHQWGGIMNMFRFSKKLLTSAVTIDPAFMLANFVRDTLSSWVVADTGGAVPPLLEALKGAKAAFTEDEDTIKIMMAGAGGGGFYDHNPADVRKMLAKKLPQGQVDSFMNSIITPRGAWRFWQKIGNAAEQANRVAKYRKVIAEGGSAAEAAYAARDILNFSMSGDFAAMKFLVQTVPFLNARIQGLYRLYRGGKEHPLGFAYKGGAIMAATMALLLRNMDDERYEELPEWDKDVYWHLFVGDEHFRLPKPFEIGAMYATVPERAIRAMSGRDDWDLFGQRMIKMFAETLQFNPTPQLLKPVVEQYANRNMFTGAPLVGFTLSNLKPEAQYDHWTSETMREWAEAMPDFAPEWLRSPKRLEAAVRGYTGAMGMYVLGAADSVTRRALGHPDRPTKALQDYPVITRFWRNPQPRTSKYTTQLYDMMNEADALYRTLNAYSAQGRLEDVQDLLEGQQGKLAARKYLHGVANQLREINNQMKIIAYSDMSAEEKRAAMDKLNAAKMQAVRQVAHVGELF
jgi:hypothetical protein